MVNIEKLLAPVRQDSYSIRHIQTTVMIFSKDSKEPSTMKKLFIVASLLIILLIAAFACSSEELNYNLVNLFGGC